MKTLAMALALALATGGVFAEKLYKWTDQDGNVHYTDQVPPPEASASEHKQFGDKPGEVATPYALQRAIKAYPVTLYSTDCGDPCSKALALLNSRGVPFADRNARDPAGAEELKALTGGKLEVPLLKVGTQVLRGYEETGWTGALDAAGYPTAPLVPWPKAAGPKPKSAMPKAQAASAPTEAAR